MQSNFQRAVHNKSFQSLVFVFTQLHLSTKSSILSAKFVCPVARQNLSRLATAPDCVQSVVVVVIEEVVAYTESDLLNAVISSYRSSPRRSDPSSR